MLKSTGTSRSAASAKAASPQGCQSTGLSACWSRYGEVSLARRLGISMTSQFPANQFAETSTPTIMLAAFNR